MYIIYSSHNIDATIVAGNSKAQKGTNRSIAEAETLPAESLLIRLIISRSLILKQICGIMFQSV